MNKKIIIYFTIGFLFIASGILIPSSMIVEFLRTTPESKDLLEPLILGATLLRIGLVIFGILVLASGRFSIWRSGIRNDMSKSDPNRYFISVILAAILCTAFVLRFYRLGNGLWIDEIMTYVNYAKAPFGEIITTYDSQNQHFLYSLLAHTSFLIFGESAWSLRLPAALFGVASIYALYLFARQVTSAREALFSAALLTFSYHHIWFSQNARGYSGLLFWTIISSWIFLRALREARSQLWLAYAAAAAIGVYTHMTMLFVINGHFIIYLIALFKRREENWPERWKGFFFGFCLAGFLTLILYALVLPQIFGGTIFGGTIGQGTVVAAWKNPVWTLLEFVKGMKIGFAGVMPAIVALAIFSVGLYSYARENLIVIGLLIIPAAICAFVVVGMGHNLWPRLFIFAFGFGVLVIVRGAMQFGSIAVHALRIQFLSSAQLGTALCTLLLLVSAVTIPAVYAPKQDYLGALTFLEEHRKPGDIIVTVGITTFPYKRLYGVNWQDIDTVESLNAIRFQAKRTWLTYTLPIQMQAVYPDIIAVIQQDFKTVKKFYGTLNGGTIFVCLYDTFN